MSLMAQEIVTRRTETYRELNQGLRTFHDHQYAEVDIVGVPGLGTNPEECWTWSPSSKADGVRSKPADPLAESVRSNPSMAGEERQFNWLRDPEGLASLFPKSRIMLYDYASAWKGQRKVRATMKSICMVLLDDLKEQRKGGTEIARPLIFIGHSMGGLVVAKTICIARARKEFEAIVTCTVGCAFFGTPFKGTAMTKLALLYSNYFGQEAYEALLYFMQKENNDTLDEVTNDFMEISNKFAPPIELFCAYEEVPTDFSKYVDKAPKLLQHKFFKQGAEKVLELGLSTFGLGTHFVDKESATLQGAHTIGLTAGHSELIKFQSITSPKFVPVRAALSKMVNTANLNVRKRTSYMGQNLLTQRFVNQVRQSLEGVDMRQKCRTQIKQRRITSWLTSEPLYQDWLTSGGGKNLYQSHLWVRGGPGLGKTNASLAAIQQINQNIEDQQADFSYGQTETFLAYFLCEKAPGCSTAEDLLKSLITQIINQEESLAQHAKWFVPNPHHRGPGSKASPGTNGEGTISSARATTTVDNLWKRLKDMINDPVTKHIYIVISNLHCLETGDATTTLLDRLGEPPFAAESAPLTAPKAKWLISSRHDRHISQYLESEFIRLIDLENDHEYGSKVKGARQKHARDAVLELRLAKKYSSDLAYYVRNSIESQSEDEKWTDVLCILLKAMPSDSTSLSIRKWLREVGDYNLNRLVDYSWATILERSGDARLEIEELLRALTVTYEPPTLADLTILTQIDGQQRISVLVQKCSPVLRLEDSSDHKEKVVFTNPEFREHLSKTTHGQLDMSTPSTKRYHGLIALRCFEHIKSCQRLLEPQDPSPKLMTRLRRSATVYLRRPDNDNSMLSQTNDAEEGEDTTIGTPESSTVDCFYPLKYLFWHLSEGFPDVAEELFEDDPQFWGSESQLRAGWLKEFQILMPDLKGLNTSGMTALHVAAGIGANELVSILVSRCGEAALSWTSENGMTALHVAAFNNHYDVVETLLRAGADVNYGDGEAGTALHYAALRGNCPIMGLLIDKKASVNAFSRDIGPVINAAIKSGTVEAVKRIMDGDIRFDLDYYGNDTPLSLSAGVSEPSLFEDILETGRNKWLQNPQLLDQALLEASGSGRLESVRILLRFPHTYSNNTIESAISLAAQEKKWASVDELLDYAIKDTADKNRELINLDEALYLAAVSREDQQKVLKKVWTFKGPQISKDVCDFSLYEATILGKNSTVVWLLETCKANPNATAKRPTSLRAEYPSVPPTNDYWNVLNAAAITGNASLVRILIHKGAAIDTGRDYALQLAAKEGHNEVVEALLQCGASANKNAESSDHLGFFSGTALQAACDNNRTEVIKALIQQEANPNLGGGQHTNPITAATQKTSKPEILEILLEAPGINVNVTGGDIGSTPLINAARNMGTESVELLLQKGADVNAQDSVGDTALIMAAGRGLKACVELLCNHGADVTHKSPDHGLAIQVAAKGLHPECAHVLAEKMGNTIEQFREEVKFHFIKKSLNDSQKKVKEQEETIDSLSTSLADKMFELDEANKDIENQRREKDTILSRSSLQRENYKSVEHQLQAMESERKEIRKQLNTSEEQLELANDEITKLKILLDEQRGRNTVLKDRYGWTALEEEKYALIQLLSGEQTKSAGLEHEIRALNETVRAIKEESDGLRATTEKLRKGRSEVWEAGDTPPVQHELPRKEIDQDARRTSDGQADIRRTSYNLGNHRQRSYKAKGGMGTSNGTGNGYFGEAARSPPVGSPEIMPASLGLSPPPSQVASPDLGARSPGSESSFRTVHGQHRPDGSFGAYRSYQGTRRLTSGSLEKISAEVKRSDGKPVDGESLAPSTTASSESAKAEEPARVEEAVKSEELQRNGWRKRGLSFLPNK